MWFVGQCFALHTILQSPLRCEGFFLIVFEMRYDAGMVSWGMGRDANGSMTSFIVVYAWYCRQSSTVNDHKYDPLPPTP